MNAPLRSTVACLAVLLAGCGLKGALELPPKSTNVVIRGPQGPTAPAPGEAAPTGAPAATPGETPAAPAGDEERQPPPALPEGNPGPARGG